MLQKNIAAWQCLPPFYEIKFPSLIFSALGNRAPINLDA